MRKSALLWLGAAALIAFSALAPALWAVQAAPAAAITGLDISASATSGSTLPGASKLYQFTLKSTNSSDITFTAASSKQAGIDMDVSLDPAGGTAPADGSIVTVNVYITPPADATAGQNNTSKITFTSGAETQEFTLTTTVSAPSAPAAPLVVIDSYSGSGPIVPGRDFRLNVRFANIGSGAAKNLVVVFESQDFLPKSTGGVVAVPNVDAGSKASVSQEFMASEALYGQMVATLVVKISYSDSAGTARSENFTLTVNLADPKMYSGGPAPTATTVSRPQLVVSGYNTSVDPLQPGTIFDLKLEVRNLGTADARAVTVVLGGGGSGDSGTPQPGGISGSGSDVSNFAPLGSSNLVYIGDVPAGQTISVSPKLIVNVNTNPGAYAFKLSFVYNDAKGRRRGDDPLITQRGDALPQVEVSTYRDPGIFYTNQMNVIPLQVTNLGRKTAVLGNMKVTGGEAELSNNISLVGVLDPGGYFTLDVNFMPFVAGPMELKVTINYTDDFNQPRMVEQTLTVNVEEMILPPEPTFDPNNPPVDPGNLTDETILQRLGRALKGFLGLDSSPALPGGGGGGFDETLPEGGPQVIPAPGGKG